jgi:hypothetical protein
VTVPAPHRSRRLRALSTVAAVLALGPAACGSDDADGTTEGGDRVSHDPPAVDARLDVEVDRRDAGLRISWTVTNDGARPLLVFDNFRGDEEPGAVVQGAYVTGGVDRGDDAAEVSRRLFPVPGDVEGVQQYGLNASELAAGASAAAVENVPLPLAYRPAAPEGGGDPLPGDPTQAVFCLGVAPADEVEARALAGAPGHSFVAHTEANAGQQTLLCSDPFDL